MTFLFFIILQYWQSLWHYTGGNLINNYYINTTQLNESDLRPCWSSFRKPFKPTKRAFSRALLEASATCLNYTC
ncbi:hypothetical protein FGO68_gene7191 [Halteria grandinella]|uniref:Secreted protein n=1 Tax=Halteria grandinella TaxID=5974 RepID=A0A8J8NGD2_HALGN|nr:hypothetical protein FGO68_gene7191 [Halteria grandinella]